MIHASPFTSGRTPDASIATPGERLMFLRALDVESVVADLRDAGQPE